MASYTYSISHLNGGEAFLHRPTLGWTVGEYILLCKVSWLHPPSSLGLDGGGMCFPRHDDWLEGQREPSSPCFFSLLALLRNGAQWLLCGHVIRGQEHDLWDGQLPGWHHSAWPICWPQNACFSLCAVACRGRKGVAVKVSLMNYTGYAYMQKQDGAIPQLAVGVIRRSFWCPVCCWWCQSQRSLRIAWGQWRWWCVSSVVMWGGSPRLHRM